MNPVDGQHIVIGTNINLTGNSIFKDDWEHLYYHWNQYLVCATENQSKIVKSILERNTQIQKGLRRLLDGIVNTEYCV